MDFLINSIRILHTLQAGVNDVELLINDLSIEGQFSDISAFKESLTSLMIVKAKAEQFGHTLLCHRNILASQVTQILSFRQVVSTFNRDERASILRWVEKTGPFWDDARQHSDDDYFELDDKLVSKTALGEAAYSVWHGIDKHLWSLIPSKWEFSPIHVKWHLDICEPHLIDVLNHWDINKLEKVLQESQPEITSWQQLQERCKLSCPNLYFALECFEPLKPCPFNSSSEEDSPLADQSGSTRMRFGDVVGSSG